VKARVTMMCAVALAGCAGQERMRQLSGDSAAVLNDYRRELTGFTQRQNALNADNQRRIQQYAENRELSEAYVRQQLLALQVADDKAAQDIYRLLATVGAEDVLAQSPLLRASAASSPAPTISFDPATVERLTRQLNALRRSPSYWDRLQRILAYGNELREAYEKSLEGASSESQAAVNDAAATRATTEIGATHPQ
jgi:hypothetical protein